MRAVKEACAEKIRKWWEGGQSQTEERKEAGGKGEKIVNSRAMGSCGWRSQSRTVGLGVDKAIAV